MFRWIKIQIYPNRKNYALIFFEQPFSGYSVRGVLENLRLAGVYKGLLSFQRKVYSVYPKVSTGARPKSFQQFLTQNPNFKIMSTQYPPKSAPTKEWDDLTASFYWYIHLDRKHADNTTDMLTGYSKKVNQKEATDKVQMLKRKIINLYNNGYFNRIKYIEIKMRTEAYINKKYDPVILILEPANYKIPELNHDYVFKNYGVFLKDLYDRIWNKKSMEGLLPFAKRNGNQDDFLNIHARNHSTEAHLYSYASRLLRNGQAPGAVNDYVRKYKELKGWK